MKIGIIAPISGRLLLQPLSPTPLTKPESQPYRPARMHGCVKPLCPLCTEKPVHRIINPTLLSILLITMRETESSSTQLHLHGVIHHMRSQLLFEVIAHPHIMISLEEINLYPFVCQLGHLSLETHIALGYHMTILKPIIEHISQKVDGLGIGCNCIQPSHQPTLHSRSIRVIVRT